MKILIVAANARSLIANRGDLINSLNSCHTHIWAVVPRYDFLDQVNDLGITIKVWNMSRVSLGVWSNTKAIKELKEIIDEVKPNKIFAFGVKCNLYTLVIRRVFMNNLDVYPMITGLGYAFTGNTWRQRIVRHVILLSYRLLRDSASCFLFQNRDDSNLFKEAGIIDESVNFFITNGSGVNTDTFYFKPRLVGGTLHFLMVSRLLNDKGIHEFVEAAKVIRTKYGDAAKFSILGGHDSSLPNAISHEILNRWKEEQNVNLLGFTEDVIPFLLDCDVFVLPSYREGTPRSILEAMSIGRAIVTTNAPGCNHTVEENVNGFKVEVGSIIGLIKSFERFIGNPDMINAMGLESRRIVLEKFDVRIVNRGILNAMNIRKNL